MNISAGIPKEPPTQKGCPTPELVPNTYWDAQLTENQSEVSAFANATHPQGCLAEGSSCFNIVFSWKVGHEGLHDGNSKDRTHRELHLGFQMWIIER